jgi:hypothetical protein
VELWSPSVQNPPYTQNNRPESNEGESRYSDHEQNQELHNQAYDFMDYKRATGNPDDDKSRSIGLRPENTQQFSHFEA